MNENFVDRNYVTNHAGVYFFVYSVPQMIAANTGLTLPKGVPSKIYHQSILFSDGGGKIETITAGPKEGRKWYKQLGLTPITIDIAFLSHPNRLRVRSNFDTTAWRHIEISQFYFKSNWQQSDFEMSKKLAGLHQPRIARVGYNLGGKNSNSLAIFLWKRLSRNPASTAKGKLDDPRVALAGFFRPGSNIDIFDRAPLAYLRTMLNWLAFAFFGSWALINAAAQTVNNGSVNHKIG